MQEQVFAVLFDWCLRQLRLAPAYFLLLSAAPAPGYFLFLSAVPAADFAGLPESLHHVVRLAVVLFCKDSQQFVSSFAFIERLDQRLNN